VRDPNQIEHDNEAFARVANGALIVTGSAWAFNCDLIITLAAHISCLRSTMHASSLPPGGSGLRDGLGSMLCAPIPHSLSRDSLIRTDDAINGMTLEQLRTGIL
jgi:hypothetical protein